MCFVNVFARTTVDIYMLTDFYVLPLHCHLFFIYILL